MLKDNISTLNLYSVPNGIHAVSVKILNTKSVCYSDMSLQFVTELNKNNFRLRVCVIIIVNFEFLPITF